MNRIITGTLTLLLLMMGSSASFAANKRCGLGSKLFGWSKGILSQSSEIVLNSYSTGGPSITYGTSGCKHNGTIFFDPIGDATENQDLYANFNYEELMIEMAQGKGEILKGFALTLGCSSESTAAFGGFMQANFSEINASGVSPTNLLDRVKTQLQDDSYLKKDCQPGS